MPNIRVLLCAFEDAPVQLTPFTYPEAESDLDLLDDLFRVLNHVHPEDGQHMPTGGKHRSLSAGDIIFVDDVPWGCAAHSWEKLTTAQVDAYTALPSSLDRLLAYRKWPKGSPDE